MLVFEAAGNAPLALARVESKAQLPFEDLVVFVGRLGDGDLSPGRLPRQFTGVGGRAKADGKRRLAVLPLPSALGSAASDACVQVLETGEGAALFLQDARACFPSLIKRNPLAFTPDSDDSDSSSDEEDKEDEEEPSKKQRTVHDEESGGDAAIDAETRAFMAKTRVKVLPALDELFHAYGVADAEQVRAAIARDRSIDMASQALCVEFPALSSPVPAGVGSGETKLGFGVLFSHASAGGSHAARLGVPLPRSVRLAGDADADESFQDATVLSLGAHRESTRHGGGKRSDEMVQNIRMRHASGTFCSLVLPSTDWPRVVDKHVRALPQLRALGGALRLRRFLGPAPSAEPVELQLEA